MKPLICEYCGGKLEFSPASFPYSPEMYMCDDCYSEYCVWEFEEEE